MTELLALAFGLACIQRIVKSMPSLLFRGCILHKRRGIGTSKKKNRLP